MQTKSEITQTYKDFIDEKRKSIETFEEQLNKHINKMSELSTGNRGIEEMLEELNIMKNSVFLMLDSCDYYEKVIEGNENNF